ncbi:iron chelate uptake ABC transporter family permease subunit [Streptomyces sp. NPDC088921]|uniref:metal ABC transporter permease n=1 Tax=unclassified Streptomyces TaxID=2593676 RepID=UPI00342DA8A5
MPTSCRITGALGALAAGVDLRLGLFAATIAVAVVTGTLGRRGRADDIVIGGVFSLLLGLVAFFLTLYTNSRGAAHGTAGVSVLFGSIFGLSAGQAWTAAAVAAVVCAAVLLMARPLLFAPVDETVAAARRVPVRVLGIAFLVLVGVCTAEATQAVGSLLLLGLLAAPAGAAHRLTDRPYRALWLSAALALAEIRHSQPYALRRRIALRIAVPRVAAAGVTPVGRPLPGVSAWWPCPPGRTGAL